MNHDWQSWAALGVVFTTAALMVGRFLRRKKKGGCAGGCGCGVKVKKPIG